MAKKLQTLDDAAISTLQQSGTTHIFCPPTIAPLAIDMLNRFSQWMDVRLYALNPCRAYWFDIVEPKRLSYLKTKGKAEHHETGNRLLASWGKQTQAMIDLLFENTALTCEENHHFISNAEIGKTTLLAQVQDSVLDLQDLSPADTHFSQDDRSIEVHVCHSLTRELEVLQDQLLALFAQDHSLLPDDVLVVTPHLKDAAPLIDAVFGTASPSRHIPYTLTGLTGSRVNPVATALLDLFSLALSRFAASDVFKRLQQPVIAQTFELDEAQLHCIHEWMTASGIRWGLDATHRGALQLPEIDAYSFKEGLQRLFLGYALPADTTIPFNSCLPSSDIEGADALTLGRFYGFVEALDDLQKNLPIARTAEAWRLTLFDLLETFISPVGNQIDDANEVREHINALCENISRSARTCTIEPSVMLHALKQALDDPARGGIPTGTVTFTSMTSLRNLPYRVICAIGLNDGAFPTTRRPPEFDLIAHAPQRGDRQRRLDERNLFLDLLLAAQDRLYLSYTGRSIRDNSELPPSVLIADLLDYLSQAIGSDARRLVVQHPLQAFSIDYFSEQKDTRLASSNHDYFHALKQQMNAHPSATAFDEEKAMKTADEDMPDSDDAVANSFIAPFFSTPLPEPEASWRDLSLDQLLRFFHHPSRYLLQQRLGMRFPEAAEELADDEPFLPERNEQRALNDRLLPLFLADVPLDTIRETAQASHEFPAGSLGKALLENEMHAMQAFADKIKSGMHSPCLPPHIQTLTFSLNDETWTLTHSFNDLRPDGLLRYRYDQLRARDYLTGWILHLFLNAALPDKAMHQTVWHGKDDVYALRPIPQADARNELQTLLGLYRNGLRSPLHFYPRSSWEYVRSGAGKARNAWQGGMSEQFAERSDPHYRQSLRAHPDPLGSEFEATAQTVFGTMQHFLEEKKEAKTDVEMREDAS